MKRAVDAARMVVVAVALAGIGGVVGGVPSLMDVWAVWVGAVIAPVVSLLFLALSVFNGDIEMLGKSQ